MRLWDKINAGITMPNCNDCENYEKKEVNEKFEDSFTIYGKKGENIESKECKILWYDIHEKFYEICFRTKNKVKNTIEFDREFWKSMSVNIVR